jgi:hypothetical protein
MQSNGLIFAFLIEPVFRAMDEAALWALGMPALTHHLPRRRRGRPFDALALKWLRLRLKLGNEVEPAILPLLKAKTAAPASNPMPLRPAA